jgi:hypothetical protein
MQALSAAMKPQWCARAVVKSAGGSGRGMEVDWVLTLSLNQEKRIHGVRIDGPRGEG